MAVLTASFAELGCPVLTRAFVATSVGKGSAHLIRSCLAHQGADADCYEAAWASYQCHYERLNGQAAELFPGVLEGLQSCVLWGCPWACLTNKPARFARELLRLKGLAGYFDQVFGGDDFARQKPDPLPLIKTCEALGVPTADAWMIGDSRNDAEAAHAAGCPIVLMRYGYNHGEPIERGRGHAIPGSTRSHQRSRAAGLMPSKACLSWHLRVGRPTKFSSWR